MKQHWLTPGLPSTAKEIETVETSMPLERPRKLVILKKGGRNVTGAVLLSTLWESSAGAVPTSSQKPMDSVLTACRNVPGARKFWGTMKSTTPAAISSVLKKRMTVENQVSVKRKHKQLASGHTLWWFVVKGEEEILTELEGEWERVCFPLSWKLEQCFKPKSLIGNTHIDSTIDQ